MNIDQLKNLLRHHGLKPNFTYGQNFLVDDIILQDIVDAADVTSADNVLEIGPGIGNLTRLLCERAGFVLSVEKDPKFLPVLKAVKKEYKNFRYEIADALEFDFVRAISELRDSPPVKREHLAQRGEGVGVVVADDAPTTPSAAQAPLLKKEGNTARISYKVVANIPYFITGKILKMLMTAENKPASITILTQKEVARNVVAKAGDLSLLAISVQLYGEPKIIQIIPARSFYPMPKVDSAVLQVKIFDRPKYEIADEKKFFKILKACFTGKRKQIHNTLKNNLMLSKEEVDKILSATKISPAARPQELSIEQWIELSKKIK